MTHGESTIGERPVLGAPSRHDGVHDDGHDAVEEGQCRDQVDHDDLIVDGDVRRDIGRVQQDEDDDDQQLQGLL